MILEWYLLIILHHAPFGALQGPFEAYESCQRMADDLVVLGESIHTPTQVFCAAKKQATGGETKSSGKPSMSNSAVGESERAQASCSSP
ncbi:MAG: hypothetical protein QM706_01085 [Nitrospira sp.]